MKATEVFVEQVLIGFLVLVALALMFTPEFEEVAKLLPTDMGGGIAKAIGLTGIAYLVGIPSDRLIDTILAGLEQRSRLQYAKDKKPAGEYATDWFPEGEWRLAVLRHGGGPLSQFNYLRSRIRLSRALAAICPVLTLAAMMAAMRPVTDGRWVYVAWRELVWLLQPHEMLAGFTIGATYFVALVVGVVSKRLMPQTKDLPLVAVTETEISGGSVKKVTAWCRRHFLAWCRCHSWVFCGLTTLCLVVLLVLGALLAYLSGWNSKVVGFGVTGGILCIVSAWSWLRIMRTQQVLLKDFNNPTLPDNSLAKSAAASLGRAFLGAVSDDDMKVLVEQLVQSAKGSGLAPAREVLLRTFGKTIRGDLLQRLERLEQAVAGEPTPTA
jgi:hypothetical protein